MVGFCVCFFFFSFFLSLFFWFRHAWLLSSHCSVVICPPLGWHKCQLPSATPEHSSCGSPWLPRGPGQERKGKHRMSLSWPCPWGVPHCAPRQAETSQVGRDQPGQPCPRGSSATPCAEQEDSCDEALAGVKVRGRHTGAKPHHGRTEVVGVVWQHPTLSRGAPADLYQPSSNCPIPRSWPLPRGSCISSVAGASSHPAALSRGCSGAVHEAQGAATHLFQHITLRQD